LRSPPINGVHLEDINPTGKCLSVFGCPSSVVTDVKVASSSLGYNLEDVHTGHYGPGSGHPRSIMPSKSIVSNVEEVSPLPQSSIYSAPAEDVKPGDVTGYPGYYYNPKAVAANLAVIMPAQGKASVPIEVVTFDKDSVADSHAQSTYIDNDDSDNNGLETQGFISLKPSVTYWKDKTRLDSLGAFSNEHWNKMKCIHFILPNMLETGQAPTPKQASVPHYQRSFAQIR
jgi:hypothetical protein